MTQSEPTLSLADAFENVELSLGAAQLLLQWLGQQVGHDTEAGRALSEGGASLTATPPPTTTKATSTSTTSRSAA